MRLPGRKRVVAAGRWIRSRSRPRAVILGYHRVGEDRHDPFRLCTLPSVFEAHLRAIRRHARPVRLLDLAAATARGRACAGAVAVTFDDGYADVLTVAKPLLERFEIPATVFIVTGRLGQEFCGARTLEADQMSDLMEGGLIELGAHSVTHPHLGSLPPMEQNAEIVESRLALERLTGRETHAFAYPHGDYREETVNLVRKAGYTCASTSRPDVCRPGSDPFVLPRFWPAERNAKRFTWWLRWWLGA